MTHADSPACAGLGRSRAVRDDSWPGRAFPQQTRRGRPPAPHPFTIARQFDGRPAQVAAVRRWLTAGLAGHPATEAAVLVADELASNAVRHTRSGWPRGVFTVYAAVGEKAVVLLVTDQGGPSVPVPRHAGCDEETGRGLDLVGAVSRSVRWFGGRHARGVLAEIQG